MTAWPEHQPKKKPGDSDPNAPQLKACTPTTVAFAPAISILGHQPSFIVGTVSGSLCKVNVDTKQNSAGLGSVVYAPSVSNYDPTNPLDTSTASERLSVGTVTASRDTAVLGPSEVVREFMEFHRSPILYLGYVELLSTSLVTLDQDGYAALWRYERGSFTGYKWFEPTKTAFLQLDLADYKPIPGSLQGKNRVLYKQGGKDGKNEEAALAYLKTLPIRFLRSRTLPDGGREEVFTPIDAGKGKPAQDPLATTGGGKKVETVDMHVVTYSGRGRLVSHLVSTYEKSVRKGELVVARPTTDRRELVVLVSYKGEGSGAASSNPAAAGGAAGSGTAGAASTLPGGPTTTLKFWVLHVETLELLPIHLTCPAPPEATMPTKPDFLITPVLESTQTDYIYLFMGTEFVIFSLNSGRRVQPRMSDADKGFSFIMRGPIPGSYPPWKFQMSDGHDWLAQFCGDVQEIRLRHLDVMEGNNATNVGRDELRIWQLGRACSMVLGRTQAPLDVTCCKWYDPKRSLCALDLADEERMARTIINEAVEAALVQADQRAAAAAAAAEARRAAGRGSSASGAKSPSSSSLASAIFGVPPYGRIPPTSWAVDPKDAKPTVTPTWFRGRAGSVAKGDRRSSTAQSSPPPSSPSSISSSRSHSSISSDRRGSKSKKERKGSKSGSVSDEASPRARSGSASGAATPKKKKSRSRISNPDSGPEMIAAKVKLRSGSGSGVELEGGKPKVVKKSVSVDEDAVKTSPKLRSGSQDGASGGEVKEEKRKPKKKGSGSVSEGGDASPKAREGSVSDEGSEAAPKPKKKKKSSVSEGGEQSPKSRSGSVSDDGSEATPKLKKKKSSVGGGEEASPKSRAGSVSDDGSEATPKPKKKKKNASVSGGDEASPKSSAPDGGEATPKKKKKKSVSEGGEATPKPRSGSVSDEGSEADKPKKKKKKSVAIGAGESAGGGGGEASPKAPSREGGEEKPTKKKKTSVSGGGEASPKVGSGSVSEGSEGTPKKKKRDSKSAGEGVGSGAAAAETSPKLRSGLGGEGAEGKPKKKLSVDASEGSPKAVTSAAGGTGEAKPRKKSKSGSVSGGVDPAAPNAMMKSGSDLPAGGAGGKEGEVKKTPPKPRSPSRSSEGKSPGEGKAKKKTSKSGPSSSPSPTPPAGAPPSDGKSPVKGK